MSKNSIDKNLGNKRKEEISRTKLKHENTIDSRQKEGIEEIEQLTRKLQHPPYIEENSKNIYNKATERDVLVGRTIYGTTAGSVYTVCRMENYPTPLSEIAEKSKADRKNISSIYRSIQREFNLAISPTGPKPFIKRYSKELGLKDEVKDKAYEILQKTNTKGGFNSKSPNGYAGATIYLAAKLSNRKISQKKIADTANTTRVTIRNIYKQQLQTLTSIENTEIHQN